MLSPDLSQWAVTQVSGLALQSLKALTNELRAKDQEQNRHYGGVVGGYQTPAPIERRFWLLTRQQVIENRRPHTHAGDENE
jgi:hypothetical protein